MSHLPRLTLRSLPVLAVAVIFSLAAPSAIAQNPAPTWSQQDGVRIASQVGKQLRGLANYSVFDWLTYSIHGKTVVLNGYASRPSLKTDAGNAVKGIPGIDSVDNQIEVLPLSTNDDRIRAAVYNRIYTQPALRKYNANQGSLAQAMGPGGRRSAWLAGGITNDPPLGFHAIHIIVKNGNVILRGAVLNPTDSNLVEIRANSVPGVFSVSNELGVESSGTGK
jgi:hyperosmotically inducible protein